MPRRRRDLPPNLLLRAARERLVSPSGSGRPMSRRELAEAVNRYLWDTYRRSESLDEDDIGKLERGEHRWPGEHRREALRAVLRAGSDAELGLYLGLAAADGVADAGGSQVTLLRAVAAALQNPRVGAARSAAAGGTAATPER